jgi:hypothetical protein
MRLPGWCETCRRPRTVRVTFADFWLDPIGTCQECEDQENSDQGDTGRRDGGDRSPSDIRQSAVVPERRAADLSPTRSSRTHDNEEN